MFIAARIWSALMHANTAERTSALFYSDTHYDAVLRRPRLFSLPLRESSVPSADDTVVGSAGERTLAQVSAWTSRWSGSHCGHWSVIWMTIERNVGLAWQLPTRSPSCGGQTFDEDVRSITSETVEAGPESGIPCNGPMTRLGAHKVTRQHNI